MRTLFIIFIMQLSFTSVAQHNFSKEFSLVSDNDLYTSIVRDRYYTNGLFLTYRTVKNDGSKYNPKKIKQYQIGQLMYTSVNPNLTNASLQDRPFAGYLYGSYGLNWYYHTNTILATELQIGVIGPSAKGYELQNFLHGLYNYPKPMGWRHQINNAFALNLNIKYLHNFSEISNHYFDFSSYNNLKAGTIFTSLSSGLYSRVGLKKLQPFTNSVAFNSNLNHTAKSYDESFLFIKPMLSYALYDATIEGSFLNNSNPVVFNVMPFYFLLEIGYRFYKKHFSYGYTYTYHTQKAKSLNITKSNNYGSIYVGYYFN